MDSHATLVAPLLLLVLLAGEACAQSSLAKMQETANKILTMSTTASAFLNQVAQIEDDLKNTKKNWADTFQIELCTTPMVAFDSLRLKANMASMTAKRIEEETKVMTDVYMALDVYPEGLMASIIAQTALLEAYNLYDKVKDTMLAQLDFSVMVNVRSNVDKMASMRITANSYLSSAISLRGLVQKLVTEDTDKRNEEAKKLVLKIAEESYKNLEKTSQDIGKAAEKLLDEVNKLPDELLKNQPKECFEKIVKEIESSTKDAQSACEKARNQVEKLGKEAGIQLPAWFYDDVIDMSGGGNGYYSVDNPDGFRAAKWLPFIWKYYG